MQAIRIKNFSAYTAKIRSITEGLRNGLIVCTASLQTGNIVVFQYREVRIPISLSDLIENTVAYSVNYIRDKYPKTLLLNEMPIIDLSNLSGQELQDAVAANNEMRIQWLENKCLEIDPVNGLKGVYCPPVKVEAMEVD